VAPGEFSDAEDPLGWDGEAGTSSRMKRGEIRRYTFRPPDKRVEELVGTLEDDARALAQIARSASGHGGCRSPGCGRCGKCPGRESNPSKRHLLNRRCCSSFGARVREVHGFPSRDASSAVHPSPSNRPNSWKDFGDDRGDAVGASTLSLRRRSGSVFKSAVKRARSMSTRRHQARHLGVCGRWLRRTRTARSRSSCASDRRSARPS